MPRPSITLPAPLTVDRADLAVLHHAESPTHAIEQIGDSDRLTTFRTQPTGAYPSAKHATFEAPLIAKIPRLA